MLPTPVRAILVSALLVFAGALGHAEAAPAAPAGADAAFAGQKAAFLALPEAARKAAQDALVWLGFYDGVTDGAFGKRTRDAILAFEASTKARADGALSADELKALLAAAANARDAVGFRILTDPKTGVKIGAPAKLLAARSGAKLDFASSADPALGALYARLSAATPTRKVAYKAMKPEDFFVVWWQEGPQKFYARFEKNEAANPPIRGFTFAYPAAQAAELDRVAIAIANSFEAFPAPAERAMAPGASAAAPPEAPGSSPVPPAASPQPSATALIVAPGKGLTAIKAEDCANPTVGGKPVRFDRTDPATGLAIIAGDFDSKGQAPRFGALAPDLVVLGFAGTRLAASPASLARDGAGPVIVASIESSAGGGPVFDRSGALVGLVAPIAAAPKRLAGVALAAPHAIIAPDAVRAFLAAGESAPGDAGRLSAGDIAAREKDSLVSIDCAARQ